ncbi:MAG TPA: serine O-acetyltransferase [Spongiibacteraceae bacterium]|nr:serine O-acetyltransferase [Spongiibacteraceae bacterium]
MISSSAPRNAAWLWQQIRSDATALSGSEPNLASFFHASLLNHRSLASALAFLLANKLGDRDVPSMLLRQVCDDAFEAEPGIIEAAAADCLAHYDRDPACHYYAMPVLYFKGFHAVQAYRVAHWLWHRQRRALALFLQNRIATVFDVDIHPAARIGAGLMVDHATGLVIGETAVVGANVSMLHGVNLGGCGVGPGPRHPQIGDGVLISAGAKLLGPISIGAEAKIAAGSVVLESVGAHMTVAGVPARSVIRAGA